MKLIAILIVLIFSYSLFAQNNGNEIYAIKVELNFSSYSNCRILDTEKPKLSSWNLKFGERDKTVQYGYQYIDTFITNNSIEDLSLNLNVNITHFDGNQSVTIDDGNLVNSTKFSIGKNYLKKSESKHCSPFHTEGFDFHPIVTIDNPIKIESTSVIGEKSIGKMSTNFVTTRQTVVFHLNEFYKENDDIELQYSIGNIDNWKPVKSYKGEFKSQGSISINYSDIVGEYSITNSDYIEKLGKCIFFRIEKTLLDGKTKVYSNTVNKNFFQDYAEFSVDETSVYMSSCGKLSLTLSDVDPITIREIRKLNIKLTQDPISYIPTISQIADDKIRLSYTFDGYSPEDLKRIAEKELFITISAEANIEEIDSINPQNIKFAHPHQAEFKISAYSEPLHFKQSAPTIVGKNKNYHLNHNETPYYAILQMDKEDKYNRIPYIVKWSDYKGTHFQKIERTNKIYDKEILRQKYFAEHNDKYFEDRWATFFNSKFNEWFNELITPQVVQKILYEENCSCPWSSNSSSEMLVPINCGDSVKIFFFNYYNLQFEDGNPKSIGSSGRYIVIKSEDNEALFRHVKDKISNYYNLEGTKITEICDDYTTYETTNKSIIGTILKNQSVPNTFSFSISKDVFNSLSFNNKDEYFIIKKGEQYCLANCNNSYYLISFLEYEQKKLLHYDNHVTKCILSYKGDACAFVSNNVLYYNNKRLGNATTINDLKSIYNNYIYYIGNDGKNYKRIIANYDDKNTYKNNFKSNYSSLYNKWLGEYKDICFQQYILMLEGYKIDNIEANTNYIFTITDNDGCPIYETGSNTDKEIDVNVQVPIKPNVSFSNVRTPSSICSQDGEVLAKINANSTEQQLYYLYNNKETIITSGTEVKLQGIGFSEIKLYSDFLEYSYASPFKISDPSEYEGIKNVISYNNSCYDTETPNGQIIVEFNKISSIKKICHLLENNKKIKSIETNGEKVSFNNLKSGNNYTIEVDIIDGNKNKCSLNWGKSISIYNSIFSYTVSNNDATTIGGKGSINIIKENNPKNFDIQWSCNKQPLNSVELPIINSAGDYKIEANWGGCVLSKGITIREPYCKANIEVIHNGAKGEIKITGTDSCLTTNGGFPYFEVDGNIGLEFKDLDINSYHTIKYVYGEGLSWVIAEVKAKNVVTENNHTFSILKPHKCSGDDAEYLITANAENVFFILNGKEYKEIRGSTSLGSISSL